MANKFVNRLSCANSLAFNILSVILISALLILMYDKIRLSLAAVCPGGPCKSCSLTRAFHIFHYKFKRGFTNVVVTRAGCFDTSYESGLKESFSCTHARYTCLRFVRASLSTTYWVGTSYTGTLNITYCKIPKVSPSMYKPLQI